MYAIFETGGKQYRVSEGDVVRIEKAGDDESLTFSNVLMVADGDKISYGNPYIESASVNAEVLENGKAKKVLVFKKKTRKNYRKLRGHRQHYTAVKIKEIKVT